MILVRIAIILIIWSLIKAVASKPPRRVVQPVIHEAPNTVELVKREPTAEEKQAKEDIEYLLTQYIPNLDALLDIAQGELAAANNLTKQERCIKKVNTLQNQIRAAEKKLAKAREVLGE